MICSLYFMDFVFLYTGRRLSNRLFYGSVQPIQGTSFTIH